MKVQYVADDGTAFETEVECKSYELSCTFGADTRFVNLVVDMVNHLVGTDYHGNGVIHFDDEESKIKLAIAIAQNFQRLKDAYDLISTKAPAKQGKIKIPMHKMASSRGTEIKKSIAKNRLTTPRRHDYEDDEDLV